MKKLVLAAIAALAISANAKEVTVCAALLFKATAAMDCDGDFAGKATIVELYKKGWTLVTDISGPKKYVLVFEK